MIIHKEDQTELLSQRLSLKSSSLNPYIPTKRDRLHESSLSIPLGLMQSPLLSYTCYVIPVSNQVLLGPLFLFVVVWTPSHRVTTVLVSYIWDMANHIKCFSLILPSIGAIPRFSQISSFLTLSFLFLPLIHLSISAILIDMLVRNFPTLKTVSMISLRTVLQKFSFNLKGTQTIV